MLTNSLKVVYIDDNHRYSLDCILEMFVHMFEMILLMLIDVVAKLMPVVMRPVLKNTKKHK